jgi:hypothetical protein
LIAELMVEGRVRRPVAAAVWVGTACVADVVSGRTAFALGLALAAGSVVALQRDRRWVAAVLAVLTTLASPVAGLFLGVVGVSWALRRCDALRLAFGAGVPMLILVLLAPEPGRMPVTWTSAWQAALAAAAVVLLGKGLVPRAAALLIAAGTVLAFLVTNPVGSNAQRLTLLFAGAALLAIGRGPRLLLIVAVAWTAYWSVRVPLIDLGHRGEPTAERADARELNGILDALGPITGRVEVVPLREHGETVEVSPLARGWLRQVDRTRAALFYDGPIESERYHQWLLQNAVQYVALADRPLDWSARHERGLLSSAPSYLRQVHQDATWTVWKVVDGLPLATGLVSQDATALVVDAPAGDTVVRLRWSRWLTVDHGCVAKQGDHVVVRLKAAARVHVASSYAGPLTGHHC